MQRDAIVLMGAFLLAAALLLPGCISQDSKQARFTGGGGCEKKGSIVGECYVFCNGTITNTGDAPGSARVSFDIVEDNGWRKAYDLGPYPLQPNQTQYWSTTLRNSDCGRGYSIDRISVWGVD